MKKMSFIFALMFSGLLAVSCGSDDDDNGSVVDRQDREEAVGKNLFSVWRDTSDTALTLDFRDYTFNEEAPFFFRTSQAIYFIVVLYGVDPSLELPETVSAHSEDEVHSSLPIACQSFKAPHGEE